MNVTIIGVPYDLDQPYRGMGKAPDALLDLIPAHDLVWLIVAAMGLTAVAALGLAPFKCGGTPPHAPRSATGLLREPAFVADVTIAD